MAERPPVVVHPPSPTGGRRVTVRGQIAGLAHGVPDLLEFLRRAGLDPEEVQLDNWALIEWRGVGRMCGCDCGGAVWHKPVALAIGWKVSCLNRLAIHPFTPQRGDAIARCLNMNVDQVPILEPADEILTQTQAYRYMGVTRPVFRGYVDRGEIHPADHHGARKSGRYWLRDVERLRAKHAMRTPRAPQPEDEGECQRPACRRLRTALKLSLAETVKERKARARARRLLDAALEDDDDLP